MLTSCQCLSDHTNRPDAGQNITLVLKSKHWNTEFSCKWIWENYILQSSVKATFSNLFNKEVRPYIYVNTAALAELMNQRSSHHLSQKSVYRNISAHFIILSYISFGRFIVLHVPLLVHLLSIVVPMKSKIQHIWKDKSGIWNDKYDIYVERNTGHRLLYSERLCRR